MPNSAPEFLHIELSVQGTIAQLRMNRPAKANALNHEHLEELAQAASYLADQAQVRVVILCGAGKHFCAGADLRDPGNAYQVPLVLRRRRLRAGERAVQGILELDAITIAAWQGGALGGGACLATACDFRIGAQGCFMRYPEIDIGINLMWKSLPLITALVGPARAKRLVAGGEQVQDQTLLDWGVLDELVAPDQLEQSAVEMAQTYCNKPPIAAQMIKQSVNQLSYALGNAVMHMDIDQNLLATSTADRAAAVQAYRTKDAAEFSGD